MFEIQAASRSEISRLLNQYAEQIFHQPKAKKTLAEEAYQTILEQLGLPKTTSPSSAGPSFLEE